MNKRFYLILVMALLFCVGSMKAVPAHPGVVKVQQPDGSYVSLRLVGDEWRHMQTTLDGYSVVKDARGFYVYAKEQGGRLLPTAQVAHDEAERTAKEQAFLTDVKKYQAPEMSEQLAAMYQMTQQRQEEVLANRRAQNRRATDYNKFKGLIILVEFNDKSFSRDDFHEIITDMVNKEGYEGYDLNKAKKQKYTGSVRDYFSDNSGGKFQPQFDIVGPYKVDYSQYDCGIEDNNNKCNLILRAAIDSADVVGGVNFKDYDGDNDGYVDLVFFVLAGNGANYMGNDDRLWWPHRSIIWPRFKKDGVSLNDYASSVELYGYTSQSSTVKIDGIGTICHEFSHVLGLPDFYDADYEKSEGESVHPGIWSVMAGGSYENYSRTPVGYSLYERYSVGFCDLPEVINAEGSYTLDPLYSSFKGYRIDSPVNDEFFLFENRQKTAFKWDAYLPGSGMLVHRVEKPGSSAWNQNRVNVNPNHNLYEVVWANGKEKTGTAADVFPGTKKVRTLNASTSPANLRSWSGKATKWGLTDIALNGGIITFNVEDTYVLKSLSLPESATIGVGLKSLLQPVAAPDYAIYQLTWSSSDNSVATVDQEGYVTGVSAGTCDVIVKSDNGLEAVCKVTIKDMPYVGVNEFLTKPIDTEVVLMLTDAQVLYVASKEDVAYVRDATGSIMFKNTGLSLVKDDVLNGFILAKVGQENGMMQVVGIEGSTNDEGLDYSSGADAEPREVAFEDLTAVDYSDLVVVKAVQLMNDGGVYAVSGDKRARLWNKFNIKNIKVPSNYEGKYYDVTAIYGTDVLNGQVIDELYLLSSPVEVEAPTGISTVTFDDSADAPLYNLQGQRVDATHRGLVIRKGRVVLNK